MTAKLIGAEWRHAAQVERLADRARDIQDSRTAARDVARVAPLPNLCFTLEVCKDDWMLLAIAAVEAAQDLY